jgi:hypothetical protein
MQSVKGSHNPEKRVSTGEKKIFWTDAGERESV